MELAAKQPQLEQLMAQLRIEASGPQARAEARERMEAMHRAPGSGLRLNPTPALLAATDMDPVEYTARIVRATNPYAAVTGTAPTPGAPWCLTLSTACGAPRQHGQPNTTANQDHHAALGDIEHTAHRRVRQSGAAVGEDEVVEVGHRFGVVSLGERLGLVRVTFGGQDLQAEGLGR